MLGVPLFFHYAGANTLPLNDASGAARMGNLEGINGDPCAVMTLHRQRIL